MVARTKDGDNSFASMGVVSTPEGYIWGVGHNTCDSGCMGNMIPGYDAYDVGGYGCSDNTGTPHSDERAQGKVAIQSDGDIYFGHTGVSAGNNLWNNPLGYYPNGGSNLDGCTSDSFCCSNKLQQFKVAFYCKQD
jgi:hypothetical protein